MQGTVDAANEYMVTVSVKLPASFASSPPPGGLRLRLRTPVAHAGRLASVTVGGKPWPAIDAKAETVDFSAKALATPGLMDQMRSIVATYAELDQLHD
jgi:hypothetical protein